jgi:hypothetical protein
MCEVPALHQSRHLAALDQTRTDRAPASLPKATDTAQDGGNEDRKSPAAPRILNVLRSVTGQEPAVRLIRAGQLERRRALAHPGAGRRPPLTRRR